MYVVVEYPNRHAQFLSSGSASARHHPGAGKLSSRSDGHPYLVIYKRASLTVGKLNTQSPFYTRTASHKQRKYQYKTVGWLPKVRCWITSLPQRQPPPSRS